MWPVFSPALAHTPLSPRYLDEGETLVEVKGVMVTDGGVADWTVMVTEALAEWVSFDTTTVKM